MSVTFSAKKDWERGMSVTSPEEKTKVSITISGSRIKYLTDETSSTLSCIGEKGNSQTIQILE